MSSEFIILSKKYACLFNEYGLSSDDVIHIIVENHNHVFGALGGMWIIGGIISFADVTTDEKSLIQQLVKTKAKLVICDTSSFKTTMKAIAFCGDVKGKSIKVASFEDLDGIDNISEKL